MQKLLKIMLTTLLASLLVACASTPTSKQSSAPVTSSANRSSSANQSQKKTDPKPTQTRLAQFNLKLEQALPGTLLPQVDGSSTGSQNLNLRYSQDDSENDIFYSVGDQPLDFNAPEVQDEKPYAVLKKFKNVTDPAKLIHFEQVETGLPQTQLDANTVATTQGAAGTIYLQFNKSDWSFVVIASSVNGEKPEPTAKQLLALVNKYGVPQTETKGSVQVRVGESAGSLNTVITWQVDQDVYQLQTHSLETAFKMLASLQ